MASTYKLTYFNLAGRAEVIRYIFAVAGVEYEDIHIDFDKWPELKGNTPFEQLPVLEVDGVQIGQTAAIGRFLARRFGLHGKTELEAALVDMVVDCLGDFNAPLLALNPIKDEALKEEKKKNFRDELQPSFLARFEKMLIKNNGGDGYFVGDTLTFADLLFVRSMDFPPVFNIPVPLENYPKLKSLTDRVNAHPKLAHWLKTRTKTDPVNM